MSGEQNGKDDQDGHSADINEDLHEADKFRAQQEVKCGHADKGHREAERGMNQFSQTCGRKGRAESEHRNEDKSGTVHSAKR
jgi:hypothetical protein